MTTTEIAEIKVFDLFTVNQRTYISLRIMGMTMGKARQMVKVTRSSWLRWRRDYPDFKRIDDDIDGCKDEILPDVNLHLAKSLSTKSLYVLNCIIDKFGNPDGFEALSRAQLSALVKCVEIGLKTYSFDGDKMESYEEFIFRRGMRREQADVNNILPEGMKMLTGGENATNEEG